ncbi:unnamed protein product [Effrenium voratum]|uniref:Uncharacterized protein n=1 Tax=Effrenium voratum TaxID=2562239 RepID=A0AA36JTG7_9DINO|nr:unnamed protein product [Effrenium voratum]
MADRDEERTEEDTEKEETDHTEPMSSVNREEEEPTFKSDSESSADGEVYESGDLNDASVTKYQAIHPDSMEDLFLPEALAQELKQCFQLFVQNSREAAAEALYDALTESLPTSSFSTPRPILSIRLITGISNLILNCGDPISLRRAAEVMAFQHLDREVNVSRLEVARDAMLAAIEIEVGVNYTARMHAGLQALLSYAAGAFLFVRKEYAIRIKTVLRSWSIANSTNEEQSQKEQEEEEQQQQEELEAVGVEVPPSPNKIQSGDDSPQLDTCEDMDFYKDNESMKVPSTFTEMFLFNAAVMGYGSAVWMNVILRHFEDIATNVANTLRLQEECDVLSLVLAQYKGTIVLSEFKLVMMAALRSLVPKEWDLQHETAWSWLWDRVEGMLKENMGKPQVYRKELQRLFLESMDQDTMSKFQRGIYSRFFSMAPKGQDFFKQSSTRLNFIIDRNVEMVMEIFAKPRDVVEQLSALGLRHVGYRIPTDLVPPFVVAATEELAHWTTQSKAVEAFSWSLSLISKILMRVIQQGSTIAMLAIVTNEKPALKKAIALSPRKHRARDLLDVTVGTQSISPLMWSIESGSLCSAEAIIEDLLVIRADRDVYYYGAPALFRRHPDVIHRMCHSAPSLLTPLLEGLIWRSRQTNDGFRRVNYYIQYLIQDLEGNFNDTFLWLVEFADPKVVSHPAVVLASDLTWRGLARKQFTLGQTYFLATMVAFIVSQCLTVEHDYHTSLEENVVKFVCRVFIYVCSLPSLLFELARLIALDFMRGRIRRFWFLPIPQRLCSFSKVGKMCLAFVLSIMVAFEPILHCAVAQGESAPLLFTSSCPSAEVNKDLYGTLSSLGLLLYWFLCAELSVYSMQVSAFSLVVVRVCGEVLLFLGALAFCIISFASAMSCLNHHILEFNGLLPTAKALMQISLGIFPNSSMAKTENDVPVFVLVCIFVALVFIILANILIAQLYQCYHDQFAAMAGYAHLNRLSVIVTTCKSVSRSSWKKFLSSLHFEEKLDFNQGDVGISGGVQILEPSHLHPTNVDTIRRFGGSSAPWSPWPEEDTESTFDKFDRLEKLIISLAPKKTSGRRRAGTGSSSVVQSSEAYSHDSHASYASGASGA